MVGVHLDGNKEKPTAPQSLPEVILMNSSAWKQLIRKQSTLAFMQLLLLKKIEKELDLNFQRQHRGNSFSHNTWIGIYFHVFAIKYNSAGA